MAARKKSVKKDYEILPVDELEEIKTKLEKYTHSKSSPLAEDVNDLKGQMNRLSDQINFMNEIFDAAQEEVELEKRQHEFMEQTIKPLKSQIDEVVRQNKIIASAILNLAEHADDEFNEIKSLLRSSKQPAMPKTQPMPQPMQQPMMQRPMSQPMQQQQPMRSSLPPMPEKKEEKKGLFSDLFK